MFTKTLSAMITAAALSFGGAAFASTPAPTNSVTTTAKAEQKASRPHNHVRKAAVAKGSKAPAKVQPRTAAKKSLRSGKKVVRAQRSPSVKPAAK